jgi:hypothetical protein
MNDGTVIGRSAGCNRAWFQRPIGIVGDIQKVIEEITPGAAI